jgi:secreted trypsin-like serine protease
MVRGEFLARCRSSALASLLAALGIGGCGGQGVDDCPSTVSGAIYGGTPDASSVGLPDGISSAVGALTTTSDSGPPDLCSGVLVSPSYLLTAAHCATGASPSQMRVSFGSAAYAFGATTCSAAPEVGSVIDVVRHPIADAMLVQLATPVRVPMAVSITGGVPSPGTQAVAAGYGLTEENTAGERLFLSTLVTNATGDLLTVNSGTDAGACAGDSGGPLFVETDSEGWQLAGVLHEGSISCTGLDIFTATAPLESWIASLATR